jgi:hypothetical protein
MKSSEAINWSKGTETNRTNRYELASFQYAGPSANVIQHWVLGTTLSIIVGEQDSDKVIRRHDI